MSKKEIFLKKKYIISIKNNKYIMFNEKE